VAERNFNLRPTPDDPAAIAEALVAARLATDPATACGGESPLLLTLPRHEKAPLLLLVLLWLLCQAANSSTNYKTNVYSTFSLKHNFNIQSDAQTPFLKTLKRR